MKPITTNEIGWGEYKGYEGPYFRGIQGLTPVMRDDPTPLQKIYYVITNTEGSNYSAINMYDQMILSVGAIQWAERSQYSVSDILGKICESPTASVKFAEATTTFFQTVGVTFKRNAAGKWRFHFLDSRGEVNSVEKQQALFLGCTGKVGSWSPEAKAYAKNWAALMANIWLDREAQKIQEDYTITHIPGFLTKYAATQLLEGSKFENLTNADLAGWKGGIIALYMSFAANNPSIAESGLKSHLAATSQEKWSEEWCIELAKWLTFSSKISIYPIRYNKIAPLIDKLFGTSFPVTAAELDKWKPPSSVPHRGTEETVPDMGTIIPPVMSPVVVDVPPITIRSDDPGLITSEEKMGFLKSILNFILRILRIKK